MHFCFPSLARNQKSEEGSAGEEKSGENDTQAKAHHLFPFFSPLRKRRRLPSFFTTCKNPLSPFPACRPRRRRHPLQNFFRPQFTNFFPPRRRVYKPRALAWPPTTTTANLSPPPFPSFPPFFNLFSLASTSTATGMWGEKVSPPKPALNEQTLRLHLPNSARFPPHHHRREKKHPPISSFRAGLRKWGKRGFFHPLA